MFIAESACDRRDFCKSVNIWLLVSYGQEYTAVFFEVSLAPLGFCRPQALSYALLGPPGQSGAYDLNCHQTKGDLLSPKTLPYCHV